MDKYLVPGILAYFAPRPPLEYLGLNDPKKDEERKKPHPPYTGLAEYTQFFETKEQYEAARTEIQARPKEPTPAEIKKAKRAKKEKEHSEAIQILKADWDPRHPTSKYVTSDPYKTIIVANLNYETNEDRLKREFNRYGKVTQVRIVKDIKTGKSRGYAFVEFSSERDMKDAYKYSNGIHIDGRKLVVDYEKGRTVNGWIPRRFGGGVGQSRVEPEEDSYSSSSHRDKDRDRDHRGRRGGDGDRDRGNRDRRYSGRDRKSSRYEPY